MSQSSNSSSVSAFVCDYFSRLFRSIPPATRLALHLVAVPLILTIFLSILDVYSLTSTCASRMFSSLLLNIYRFLLSPWFDPSPLSAVGALFAVQQIGTRLEMKKGTIWLMTTIIVLSVLINVGYLLFIYLYCFRSSSLCSSSFPCSSGLWPTVAALLAIDSINTFKQTKHFPFIPVRLPSPWLPILVVCFYCLFVSLQPAALLGLIVGYALAKPLGKDDQTSIKWLERSPLGSYFRSWPHFVSFSDAGRQAGLYTPFPSGALSDGGSEDEPAPLLQQNTDSGALSAYDKALADLETLGFSRAQSARALLMSDGSVDGALQWMENKKTKDIAETTTTTAAAAAETGTGNI